MSENLLRREQGQHLPFKGRELSPKDSLAGPRIGQVEEGGLYGE